MSSTNWNQLYRPRRVQDLHLTSVRSAVQNLMAAPHFPQALLFAGPKGTGKTSVARIIGAMLNDPANDAAVGQRFFAEKKTASIPLVEPDPSAPLAASIYAGQSYVVQELDAASNRGIDDVRALKERCSLPPAQGRMAVFILDEVHMLTIEAFNALLKLLEEPPAHVVFVLATTELHKLPDTIISRCQVIRFHKATPAELAVPLTAIIADQKLPVPATTIELIAQIADGSFRDAVKTLQQFVHQGASSEQLSQLTESVSDDELIHLLQAVIDKEPKIVLKQIDALRQAGADEQFFMQSLLHFLHQDLLISLAVIDGTAHFNDKVTRFFLLQLSAPDLQKPAPIPFLRLELALLELIDRAKSKADGKKPPGQTSKSEPTVPTSSSSGTTERRAVTPGSQTKAADSPKASESVVVLIEQPATDVPRQLHDILKAESLPETVGETRSEQSSTGNGQLLCEKWQELIAKATEYNFGLAALLRSAQPVSGSDGTIVLRVYYTFHKEQLLQKKWRQFWDDITTELTGGVVVLDCIVEQLSKDTVPSGATATAGMSLEALAVDALMH